MSDATSHQLTYSITLEDLVAFNRYHVAGSKSVRQSRWLVGVGMLALLIGLLLLVVFFSNEPSDWYYHLIVVSCAILGVLYALTIGYRRSVDQQARRLYGEGANRGLFSNHHLVIDAQGITDSTVYYQENYYWPGIERMVETIDYVFIYNSAMSAYVIPKREVPPDALAEFVAAAKVWHQQSQAMQ